jgi:hypothetical protein
MYLKIYCDVCGGNWEVYQRDDWTSDKARQCPHCFAKIDRQTWNKQIIPAFAATADANAELVKDSTGYHKPLFTVDFIADTLYRNRQQHQTCPIMDQLAEGDF